MIFCKKTCIKAIQKNVALIIHRGIELSKRIPRFFILFYFFRLLLYINRTLASLFVDQDRMLSGSIRGKKTKHFCLKELSYFGNGLLINLAVCYSNNWFSERLVELLFAQYVSWIFWKQKLLIYYPIIFKSWTQWASLVMVELTHC